MTTRPDAETIDLSPPTIAPIASSVQASKLFFKNHQFHTGSCFDGGTAVSHCNL
jgi:hypothetical protein